MTTPEMPERPHEHVLETVSIRKFEAGLGDWTTLRVGSDDYGIDMQVEIFRGGRATGDMFAVQLKAKTEVGAQPKTVVKRTSLNYWNAQAIPTLIVLWDEKTDQLWLQWVHHLPYEEDTGTKTRTIHLKTAWSADTRDALDEEVQAYRAAVRLHENLPLDILVSGDRFYGQDSAPMVNAIYRLLQPVSQIQVKFTGARIPHVFVDIHADGITVGVKGRRGRDLTWGGVEVPVPWTQIAADVAVAVAFSIGEQGRMASIAADILERSAQDSGMLLANGRLADSVAELTRANKREALQIIFERTHENEDDPYAPEALVGFMMASSEASKRTIRSVAKAIRRGARNWSNPGPAYYNVGNMLRGADPKRALEMYESAAEADPSYRERGYWWREQGAVHFESFSDPATAERFYEEAIRAGDTRAIILLADCLQIRGQYKESLELLRGQDLSNPADASWRLVRLALEHIVNELGIMSQQRGQVDLELNDDMLESGKREPQYAVTVDALDGWAHWGKCPGMREAGQPVLNVLIAAAASTRIVPEIWDELIRSALECERLDVAHDGLWCAREYCGPEFVEMLLTDEILDADTRNILVILYESIDPVPKRPLEIRDADGVAIVR